MEDFVLIGKGSQIVRLPRSTWEGHLAQVPSHSRDRLGFMTPNHHRIRNFAVVRLPELGRTLAPREIASSLDLQLEEVNEILDELERNLFFLVRSPSGEVSWAFPVTVEPTPYRITFDSGGACYAA